MKREHSLTQNFGNAFDRFARDFFSPMIEEETDGEFMPKVEVKETAKGYQVLAELPGMKAEDIDVSLRDNSIVISGEKRNESVTDKKGYYRSEFSYGSFYRTIPLRDDVDNSAIQASYKNGVLTVDLTKRTDGAAKSQKIEIRH